MGMDYNKTYNKILTDEELMETKQHGSSDYPFQYYYDNLELFDFHCIEWHWHREFEFLYVESGQVTCGIGEKQIILSEGEAIFINSKILHRFYASSSGIIPNFVCMPEFIAPENSLIYKKYILPIISSNIYFQRFQTNELWQTKIIQTMIKIMEIQGNEKIRELATLALLQDLWLTFYENVKLSDKGDVQTVDEVAQKRVQLIMQYIHENYNRNLSLDEIASHIGTSVSFCFVIQPGFTSGSLSWPRKRNTWKRRFRCRKNITPNWRRRSKRSALCATISVTISPSCLFS